MPRIRKLTLGVLLARHSFRIQDSLGLVADSILDGIGTKALPAELFGEVAKHQGGPLQLRSTDHVRQLKIDGLNFIYTRDHYKNTHGVDWDLFCSEVFGIWNLLAHLVPLSNIKRIGIVGEYRIGTAKGNPTSQLLQAITKLPSEGEKAKFNLQFETRYPSVKTEDFDIEKQSFLNVNEQYYDSELDDSHPDPGQVNTQLDVQQYFNPPFKGPAQEEIIKLHGQYVKHEKNLKERLTKFGLLDGKE